MQEPTISVRRSLLPNESPPPASGADITEPSIWADALDAIRDPLFVHDEEGRILAANRAYCRQAGLSAGALQGRPYWEVFPRRDGPLPGCCPETEDAAACGNGEALELEDGRIFNARCYPSGAGQWLQILEEVTEQYRVRQRLESQEARFQAIFDATRDVSFIIVATDQEEPRIIEFSPGAEQLFGYSREEMLGQTVAPLHLPADVARFPEVRAAMTERRDGFRGETTLVRRDGSHFPALFTTYPLFDADGTLEAALGVAVDISAQKATEETLRRSEERFALATAAANEGLWDIDMVEGGIYVSPRWLEIYGSDDTDASPYTVWTEHLHPDDREWVHTRLHDFIYSTERTCEATYRIVTPQGTRWIADRALAVRNADGTALRIVGSNLDITEMRRAQSAEAHLTRLYAVLSEANKAIVRIREPQPLLEEICRILIEHGGFRAAWFGFLDPSRRHVVPAAAAGTIVDHIMQLRISAEDPTYDGSPALAVLDRGQPMIVNDISSHVTLRRTLSTALDLGLHSTGVFPVREGGVTTGFLAAFSGETDFFDAQHTQLLAGLADDVSRALDNLHDEAARIAAEQALQRAHGDLEQRVRERTVELEQKNYELESFSYSVSHDLRGPLRTINGFASLLVEEYREQLDADGCDYLNRIRAAALRMDQLIDGLLTLSRIAREELHRTELDVAELAHQIIADLKGTEPQRRVKLITPRQLMVNADPHLLRVALENLLRNAWKFTAQRPEARIELGTTMIEGRRFLFVRDNGVGFDMAHADKLFRPFERLHLPDEFPGTGIGLATVARIVNAHGGTIYADGTPRSGATFYFTLG